MRIAVALAMICLSWFSATSNADDVKPPNFVFIMADALCENIAS